MLALQLIDGQAHLDLDAPVPERRSGEARIRVRVAGVCDTDLQLARGYMGFRGIPGHEFVGTVLEADDAAWIGRRVVADINAGCGTCDDCVRAREGFAGHHCAARSVLGIVARSGAFAEQLVVPERCLVAVPDEVPDDLAVFAEPVAAALHVEDELTPADRRVAVLGDGKLGLLIALALRGRRRDVTLIGRHARKLAIAERAGIRGVLEPAARDLGPVHDAVVDATGSPDGLALAMALCRPRGTVVLKTTVAGPLTVDLSPAVIHELRLAGSRCGDLGRAVRALRDGEVDPRPLIEARHALDDAALAFEHAGRKGVLKVLVVMDSGRGSATG
jgi:threonine dehydrogenase-like Zn-dependent dehydrogenase